MKVFKKTVLAGGRFNIIHPGHVNFLEQARSLGTRLVVVVASDKTIKASKKNLLFPEEERKKMVESLKPVDEVIIGYSIKDQNGYLTIIRDVKPDIIALGYDQDMNLKDLKNLIKIAEVDSEIVRLKNYKGYKTKKIIKRKITRR